MERLNPGRMKSETLSSFTNSNSCDVHPYTVIRTNLLRIFDILYHAGAKNKFHLVLCHALCRQLCHSLQVYFFFCFFVLVSRRRHGLRIHEFDGEPFPMDRPQGKTME